MPQPQTSMVIPVRNGIRFIGEAIGSARPQLEPWDEIIVVDDTSTDNTAESVEAICDPRIKLLKGVGLGVAAARNMGLNVARGNFIAFLDHDDIWPVGRHRALLSALLSHPERGASFGRVRVRMEPGVRDTAKALEMDGKHIRWLVGSGLYRRAVVFGIGGFCEQMRLGEDVDFSQRLIEAGLNPLLCETDSLVYRRHETNITNDIPAVRAALIDVLRRKLARQATRK